MKKLITKKQKVVYDFLVTTIKKNKIPPTIREICDGLNLSSTSTVHSHLTQLEQKGYIKRNKSKNRAIELVLESNQNVVQVPILGKITAGEPILALENIENSFPISENIIRNREVFMLKVVGDSMINVGILDGDLILVNKQNYANNKDIVVALIDDSATVKTFYKENKKFRLQPENDNFEPIILDEVIIQGKVIGLYRNI